MDPPSAHESDRAWGAAQPTLAHTVSPDPYITRRRFIQGAAGAMGAVAIGASPAPAAARRARFDHVVVVMMENRSFDHLLGWLPGADGRQAGLTFADAAGVPHATHPLAPDFQGCGLADPDHTFEGGRVAYDGGACDGWLRAGANDDFAIGYYGQADLPFLGRAAPQWTTFSRWFPPILAPTYPNRIYQHAGQTDRIGSTRTISTLPTIWDRLASAGLKGRYYFTDLPFLAFWGTKYLSIGRPTSTFFAACKAGRLPHVAFVEPRFTDEASGTSADDHPHGDLRAGEAFMARVYRAVTRSPAWPRTVLIFTFDEWGGFFDHVPPPPGPIPAADAAAGNSDGLRGFRVPTVLVSPFARRGHVSTRVYDHTSILRMIEARWSLRPLSVRDSQANDPADELIKTPRLTAPSIAVPPAPAIHACAPTPAPAAAPAAASRRDEWAVLHDVAERTGWLR
jgi:phospholipase C